MIAQLPRAPWTDYFITRTEAQQLIDNETAQLMPRNGNNYKTDAATNTLRLKNDDNYKLHKLSVGGGTGEETLNIGAGI